jgi:hypothetical protein
LTTVIEPVSDSPPLHPEVTPLSFLLGTWVGHGEGDYPTVAPFRYREQLEVSHVGKAFLTWSQRTWSDDDHRPLHAETGYLRPGTPGHAELVVAHPNGLVELSEGTVDGTALSLRSRLVGRTSTAKEVTALTRHIDVDGDELRYLLTMAAVGRPQADHLRAALRRVAVGSAP